MIKLLTACALCSAAIFAPFVADESVPENIVCSFPELLQSYESYCALTSGSVTTKKGFVNYTQNINCKNIKSGADYYLQLYSESKIVKASHSACCSADGEKVVYNHNNGGWESISKNSYKREFGVAPDCCAFGGININSRTLKNCTAEKSSNGYIRCRGEVYISVQSVGELARQAAALGGFDRPQFSSLSFVLSVRDDGLPVSFETDAVYQIKVPVLGKVTCTQKLKTVFKDLNSAKIPKIDI